MWYAKSMLSNGRQPTVKEHLTAVAALAKQYGAEISMAEAAELAGQLHDFGKYGASFQKMLREQKREHRVGINHAACGAALLLQLSKAKRGFVPVIESIRGHHAGLVSCIDAPELLKSIAEDSPREIDGKQMALAGKAQYKEAYRQLCADIPEFHLSRSQMLPLEEAGNDLVAANLLDMLTTRMLFSCLVDADHSVSAQEEDESYLRRSERGDTAPAEALAALNTYLTRIQRSSDADGELNRIRTEVFTACGEAGEQEPGVFNLTAPTGVGKTLSLLHFALRHCEKWGKKRIIVVLPFLSLTEQSAETYRRILPELLEDTSQSRLGEDEYLYTPRWRVPFLITTSVKFFETLFSDRPGECRRLHNIANSVILFDEAQTLPPELVRTTIQATDQLCSRWGCTMVFSTATQPDYSALPEFKERRPREILPDHGALYAKLRRTRVEWRLDEAVSWEALSRELAEKRSVCVIVNLRKHARALYQCLSERCAGDELFFLTTDLCPAHRSARIDAIRKRLEAGLPCRVVSTQCIEAGVDLDFDAVFRALAPLDSIIQAAGRCNRNGRLPGGGRVVVFLPRDEAYPGDWYRNCAVTVQRLHAQQPLDIHDPMQIRRYYQEIFRPDNSRDKRELTAAIWGRNYQKTAQAYKIIEEKQGARVIVPFIGQMDLYNEVVREAKCSGMSPALMKLAAPITVNCFAGTTLDSFAENIPFAGRAGERESPFYFVRAQSSSCYRNDTGLQAEASNEGNIF